MYSSAAGQHPVARYAPSPVGMRPDLIDRDRRCVIVVVLLTTDEWKRRSREHDHQDQAFQL